MPLTRTMIEKVSHPEDDVNKVEEVKILQQEEALLANKYF